MKKIITLALLLCISSNIIIASDTYTIPNNIRAIPISHEIAINNLQTSISRLEIRLARLAGVDRLKTYWASLSIALSAVACASIDTSSYISAKKFDGIRAFSALIGVTSGLTLALFLVARSVIKRDILLLREQIDRLFRESQQYK